MKKYHSSRQSPRLFLSLCREGLRAVRVATASAALATAVAGAPATRTVRALGDPATGGNVRASPAPASVQSVAQPAISTHPKPQAIPLGGGSTLWVDATGDGPLTYQWFRNGPTNPLAGATNAFLVLREARSTDAGGYQVRVENPGGDAWSTQAAVTVFARGLTPFGTLALPPAFQLNGVGTDVDSIALWEAPEPTNTLLLVTAKGNDRVEVWKYPFQSNELSAVQFPSNINGIAVDQETDRLYVSDRTVTVMSLPSLQRVTNFGQGIIGVGENNLALLKDTNGQTVIYVSEDHKVHRFLTGTWQHLGFFAPPVTSIETVVADSFYQAVLVPEEQGPVGNPGVYAYHPAGAPFPKNGTNRFGATGVFDSDEEGILLYTFPADGLSDNGVGFYVVTDQRSDVTDFEFFDRERWTHLGRLRLTGVLNTDGIASTQRGMPGYPKGLFAAINNDTTTAVLGWDVIFQALGVNLAPRVVEITPRSAGPVSTNAMDFTVRFSAPVTNFNDASDLVFTHRGTAGGEAVVTGGRDTYNVRVSGLSGNGYFMLTVDTAGDVVDLETNVLLSSVTSEPVFIEVGGPSLTFTAGGDLMTLQWPSDAGAFAVWATTNLPSPVAWAPAPESAVVSGGLWKVAIAPTDDGSRFFRLQTP